MDNSDEYNLTNNTPEESEEELYENRDYYDEDNSSDALESEDNNVLNISCPICKDNYNKSTRVVHVIFPCGHSFCSECLSKINLCAICREPIENEAINWSIHGQITGNDFNKIDMSPIPYGASF